MVNPFEGYKSFLMGSSISTFTQKINKYYEGSQFTK